jgi:hypothetical protein
LLPILSASQEDIESGFRTLLQALRHQFDEKVAALPDSQLRLNQQQHKDNLSRELDERED